MILEIDSLELERMLADASELGAKRALIETGAIKPFISLSQAYKMYGRGIVDRWIKERLVIPQKDGDKNHAVRLERMRLEVLSKSSNRLSFFQSQECIID